MNDSSNVRGYHLLTVDDGAGGCPIFRKNDIEAFGIQHQEYQPTLLHISRTASHIENQWTKSQTPFEGYVEVICHSESHGLSIWRYSLYFLAVPIPCKRRANPMEGVVDILCSLTLANSGSFVSLFRRHW